MAKYKKYRNYYKRSRAKWSPNIRHQVGTIVNAQPSVVFSTAATLCQNNTGSAINDVAQMYTVKNIEFNGTFESSSSLSNIEGLIAYIMYVPQGMTVSHNYDTDHPEYIMAMKYFGSPSPDGQQQFQPIRVKTRLSRKLNTGDYIILYVKGYNVGTSEANLEYSGVVRFWTKAN